MRLVCQGSDARTAFIFREAIYRGDILLWFQLLEQMRAGMWTVEEVTCRPPCLRSRNRSRIVVRRVMTLFDDYVAFLLQRAGPSWLRMRVGSGCKE